MALAKLANPIDKVKEKLAAYYAQHEGAQAERAALHTKHAKIFAKERELTSLIETVQEGIKSLVRSFYVGKPSGQYEDFRGDLFTVKVQAKYATEIDADGLLAELPALRDVPGVIVTSVDRAKVKALIDCGQISGELVAKYTTTKQSTSAVSFMPTAV